MDIIIKQRILGSLVLIAIAIVFVPALMSGNASVFHQSMKSNIPTKPAFVIDLSEEQKARLAMDNEKMLARMKQDNLSTTSAHAQEHAFPLVESLADNSAATTTAKQNKDNDKAQHPGLVASQPIETGDMQLGPIANAKKTSTAVSPSSPASQKTSPAQPVAKPSVKVATSTSSQPSTKAQSNKPAPVQVAKLSAAPATVKSSSTAATTKISAVNESNKAKVSTTAKSQDAQKTVTASPKGWVIQVASFHKSANATAMQKRLARHGMESSIVKNRSKNGMLYRVRIGPWNQKQDAAQQQAALEKLVGLNTMLVKNR